MKILTFAAVILLLYSFTTNRNPTYARRIFFDWNKATLRSLESQIMLKSVRDSFTVKMLKNRLEVYGFSLYDVTFDRKQNAKVDPVRLKFLNEIKIATYKSDTIFTVETETGGEIHNLKNYLIKSTPDGNTHISAYNYARQKWIKVKDTTISKLNLNSELTLFTSQVIWSDESCYPDDVILSRITGKKILSNFCIFGTIRPTNHLWKILRINNDDFQRSR